MSKSPSPLSGYPRSPLPAFPPNYRQPPTTAHKKEESSIFRVQQAQKRTFSSLPPHANQQNSIDIGTTQITSLQLQTVTTVTIAANSTPVIAPTPLPTVQRDSYIDHLNERSKKLDPVAELDRKFWSRSHIHELPNPEYNSPLYTACAEEGPGRLLQIHTALDTQPDLGCLSFLWLIIKLSENHFDRQVLQHPIFARSIAAFTHEERSLFVRVLSLANFPSSQELRNHFKPYFFQSKGVWVNEETKIAYVLKNLQSFKGINPSNAHLFPLYKFEAENAPLLTRLPRTIDSLEQRCKLMLQALSEGEERHLPVYFFELGEELTEGNFPTVASLLTTQFNFTHHQTNIALPRYVEFIGNVDIPICKIDNNLIKENSICAIVDSYDKLGEITIITSNLDPSGKIGLITNWEIALLNLVLNNSNFNLESKPIPPSPPIPVALTPIPPPPSQHVIALGPLPTPQINVPSMVAQVATITHAQTPTNKRKRKDLSNTPLLPTSRFKNKYSMIKGALQSYLNKHKARPIYSIYLHGIEDFPDVHPHQKESLQQLYTDPQYLVPGTTLEYIIPIQDVLDILNNTLRTSPNLVNRQQPLSQAAPVSSSTSSSPPTVAVSFNQASNNAKKAAITFPPPDKASHLPHAELDRLFAIRKTANEKTLTREEQIQVFVHRQLGDTLIRPHSQEIMEINKQELPSDFFDNHPYLKPMKLGEVGESFWATKAYSWFNINRFVQTAFERPEGFRNATKEGLMNTYYRELKPSEAEIKAARESLTTVKNNQEIRLKKILEHFGGDIQNLEEMLPPVYRHTWDDFDREDFTLLGEVVGYHPEFEFNFKTVQTLLYHTILNVRTDELCQQFRSGQSHPKFAGLIALELLKYAQPGNEVQLIFRDGIICPIPHHGKPWSEEQTVFVDYNTFDRANTLGLNARLLPNEPLLLWKLYNALEDFEKKSLKKAIKIESRDLLNERTVLVCELLQDFAVAIYHRYILVNSRLIPERRSSPIKYPNRAIIMALHGCSVNEIENDLQFETSVWRLST